MSQGVTLDPVYQKIKAFPDDELEIPLEGSSSISVSEISEGTASGSSRPTTLPKIKLHERLGRCVAVALFVGFALYVTFGVGAIAYLGTVSYQCFHPRFYSTYTYKFQDNEGSVSVRTSPDVDKITLEINKYAPTAELLDTMVSQVTVLEDNVFSLYVQQPAFDWVHCQHADLELVIPERFRGQSKFTLEVNSLIGAVYMHNIENVFTSVKSALEIGYQKLDHVQSRNISVSSHLGYAQLQHVTSHNSDVNINVGAFGIRDLYASGNLSTQLNIGGACISQSVFTNLSMTGNVNFVELKDVAHLTDLSVEVQYGRVSVAPLTSFRGDFDLVSPYGFIDFTADPNFLPVMRIENPARVAGTQSYHSSPGRVSRDTPRLRLVTSYASLHFHIPTLPSDIPIKSRHHEHGHGPRHHRHHGHHGHHSGQRDYHTRAQESSAETN